MLSRASIAREEKSVTAFKASNRLILQLGANVPGDSELKAMLPYYPPYPRALKLNTKSILLYKWIEWNDSTSVYNILLNILSPVLRLIAQKKKIIFKILWLTDNGPGHPRALMDVQIDEYFHVY